MQPSRDGPSSTVISPTATPSASSRRHASRARVVAWAADWMAAGRIGGADAGTAPSRRARAGGHALVRCAWARHRLSLRVFDRFRCGEGFRERVLARGGPRLSVGVRLAAAHRELFGSRATTARREGRGLWSRDRSRAGFVLHGEASLGVHGPLVFPKVFRRAVSLFREGRAAWRKLSDLLAERDGVVRVASGVIGRTFAEAELSAPNSTRS